MCRKMFLYVVGVGLVGVGKEGSFLWVKDKS